MGPESSKSEPDNPRNWTGAPLDWISTRPGSRRRLTKCAPAAAPSVASAVARDGSRRSVEVLQTEGEWLRVTVDGSQFGRRTGYVLARFVRVSEGRVARGWRIEAVSSTASLPEASVTRASPKATLREREQPAEDASRPDEPTTSVSSDNVSRTAVVPSIPSSRRASSRASRPVSFPVKLTVHKETARQEVGSVGMFDTAMSPLRWPTRAWPAALRQSAQHLRAWRRSVRAAP